MKMDCSTTPGIIICGSLYTYSAEEKLDAQRHINECPACNETALRQEKNGKLPYGLKARHSTKSCTLSAQEIADFQKTRPAHTTDFSANTWDTHSEFALD